MLTTLDAKVGVLIICVLLEIMWFGGAKRLTTCGKIISAIHLISLISLSVIQNQFVFFVFTTLTVVFLPHVFVLFTKNKYKFKMTLGSYFHTAFISLWASAAIFGSISVLNENYVIEDIVCCVYYSM